MVAWQITDHLAPFEALRSGQLDNVGGSACGILSHRTTDFAEQPCGERNSDLCLAGREAESLGD